SHIDAIIKGIFAEGQLDESELTFKDLHYLSENFQRILTGIFHQRITYPDAKKPAQDGARKQEAPKEGKHAPAGEGARPANGREGQKQPEAAAPTPPREAPSMIGDEPIAL
ncbi:MAG: HD family phosphohydrolase, partial [Desulfovibrio sp.]|nr:HD family phosphohydrolase [Desulfovibrio sp.]